jgi:hypothetical protein
MAVTATPIYPQAVIAPCAALINGTGAFTFAAASNTTTNLVSLAAGGANGTKIEAITVSTTDTAANTLYLIINNGTYNFILGVFSIPIGAGTTTTAPAVGLLNSSLFPGLSYDSAGNKYLYVPSGSTLYVGTLGAVTSAKQVSVVAVGGNF